MRAGVIFTLGFYILDSLNFPYDGKTGEPNTGRTGQTAENER